MRAFLLVVVALAAAVWVAEASNSPLITAVNTHFTKPVPGEADMIAQAFQTTRLAMVWEDVETEKGKYDFAAYDVLIHTLENATSQPPMITLGFTNPFYDGGLAPYTDEGRDAFAAFAVAACQRYSDVFWELWDQPDVNWTPKPSASAYAALAVAVGDALQSECPSVLAGPSTSGFDMTYIGDVFDGGALKAFGAVSVQGYSLSEPEDWMTAFDTLQTAIDSYNLTTAPAIICSSWGVSSIAKKYNVTTQADWLARQYLSVAATNTYMVAWYDWHDDGPNATVATDHFGTVYYTYNEGQKQPYAPKPSYTAAMTLKDQLSEYVFVERIDLGKLYEHEYALQFAQAGNSSEIRIATWSSDYFPKIVPIPTQEKYGCYRMVSAQGVATGRKCAGSPDHAIDVVLTRSPLYLQPDGSRPPLAAEE